MSRVGSKDTSVELSVRKELHAIGLRYRLHDKKLPGTPDLVFSKYNAVLFVNGCFWHGHNCRKGRLPASNVIFWKNKIKKNKKRDVSCSKRLRNLGFRVGTIWQCSIAGRAKTPLDTVGKKVKKWLVSGATCLEI